MLTTHAVVSVGLRMRQIKQFIDECIKTTPLDQSLLKCYLIKLCKSKSFWVDAYLKGINFCENLFSRMNFLVISRELIFAKERISKISREQIFANEDISNISREFIFANDQISLFKIFFFLDKKGYKTY